MCEFIIYENPDSAFVGLTRVVNVYSGTSFFFAARCEEATLQQPSFAASSFFGFSGQYKKDQLL